MDKTLFYGIIIIVLLILSAFFSSSETALTSMSKVRLKRLRKHHPKRAASIEKTIGGNGKFLTTILIGNNLVNIGSSSLVSAFAIQTFGDASLGISTLIITTITIIFGEMTPKTIASKKPDGISVFSAAPIRYLGVLMTPVIFIISKITDFISSMIIKRFSPKRPSITQEELEDVISLSKETGVLEEEETSMMGRVFKFTDQLVQNVMTPKNKIKAIKENATFQEIQKVFKESLFSRIPVYETSIDRITGFIHYKDVLYVTEKDAFSIKDIQRPVIKIPAATRITEAKDVLRKHKQNIAIVIDKKGRTVGLLSMEDILEEIFGGIQDEFDTNDTE